MSSKGPANNNKKKNRNRVSFVLFVSYFYIRPTSAALTRQSI
jgi:hypothetical protein